ncbi:MAG TPA: RluA family pseudouridine synthase [Gaiella sp.]|uniref:RluA family pseudouridine synthase n=1 Tax=Gaiella sp. TaxID=2663207 RepID=UPI002D80D64E|nr:RluA family pseudouridine synthase [Gaiella sp.]HET9286900.1 RluA family pseudouridine synthase [Gaiella sp.]
MARHRSRVSDADAGRRLDAVVAELPGVGTRALAERLVVGRAVLVDGIARPKSHRLAGGEELEVDLPGEVGLAPIELPLEVVFEDAHLLVVDKPAGLVVHPSGPEERATLAHGLVALGAAGGDPERPGIVHRLDRDTSGLLAVARSPEAHARLTEAIGDRRVERRYLALVRGQPRSRTGRITAPIGRDRRDRTRHSLDTATPREAVTWFELREPLGERALLEIRLETGRTHQIRVHLEAVGLPVCGDPTYGVAGDLGLERQFLHAHRLRLVHPFTGEELDLTSPLPPDLAAALERARETT